MAGAPQRSPLEGRAGLHRLLAAMLDAAPSIQATGLLRSTISTNSLAQALPPITRDEGE